jgi:membrane dipeptidase
MLMRRRATLGRVVGQVPLRQPGFQRDGERLAEFKTPLMLRAMKIIIAAALAAFAAVPALADPALDTANAVLTKAPIIDGHNDVPNQIRDLYGNVFSRFDFRKLSPADLPKMHTDLPLLKKGKVGAQFWSVWVDPKLPPADAAVRVFEQVDTVQQLIATYPDSLVAARTAADIESAIKRGKIASLIGMEGGAPVTSLAMLRQFHRAGVGYITITHSLTTDWADAATDAPRHKGLTSFGVDVLREMNRLGMLIDLSHVSEATMAAALEVSNAPVIFSHSSARGVTDHPRNVPDTILKRLPANGGVVMVTFVPFFVSTIVREHGLNRTAEEARLKALFNYDPEAAKAALAAWDKANPEPKATIKDVADHIDHVRKVAGIDHVGIGGDYAGVDTLPEGLETVGDYPALFAELVRRGYSRADLAKISQGNILRVMRTAEAVAAR